MRLLDDGGAGPTVLVRVTLCVVVAVLASSPIRSSEPPNWHVTPTTAQAIRQQIITDVWKAAGYPARGASSLDRNVPLATLESPIPLLNLASIDQYTIAIRGVVIQPWLLRPRISSGRLAVIPLGHTPRGTLAGTLGSPLLVNEALRRGSTVLVVPMPPGGAAGHDTLGRDLSPSFNPLVYFVEPAIAALNQYVAEANASPDVVAMGISGGGWTTVLLAALDTRIRISIAVAGSLPLALRDPGNASDYGDWEQRLHGVTYDGTHALDYPDLYLLGVTEGRRQTQVNNEFDSCCFYGRRHTVYADSLTAVAPSWTFHLDSSHRQHTVGEYVLSELVGRALGPSVLPEN